ncbi:type IX secretion/gliding motility protein PorT/SprT [Urechidicola croceus]|uniref:PorT protein n=1 Tax=Urechidicola croceus TaxID=1850246 RepID=A0A1D8PAS1_9FLAO|nr:porin family protein [Urechidicola croceus]AOW21645.1 PorT protein [Urechidicola croceus]
MKKISFLIICCSFLSILKTNAQREVIEYQTEEDKKTIHWGYYLGFNKKDFKISYLNSDTYIETEPTLGFNVGLIGGWKLHNNVTLRIEPGLSSNTKTLAFTNIPGGERDSIRKVGGTYMHVPLLLKLSTNRLGNMRPYIVAGVSYDYNFSSNEKNPDDNFSGEFRMKSHNFGYEVGFGVDLYLPYFILSPSIRGTFAINNELVPDNTADSPWTGPIDYFGTRGVFINLAFH